MVTRLGSDSESRLPLLPECWEEGVHQHSGRHTDSLSQGVRGKGLQVKMLATEPFDPQWNEISASSSRSLISAVS